MDQEKNKKSPGKKPTHLNLILRPILCLGTSSDSTLGPVAYCLAFLAVDEKQDALPFALAHYGHCMKDGLQQGEK